MIWVTTIVVGIYLCNFSHNEISNGWKTILVRKWKQIKIIEIRNVLSMLKIWFSIHEIEILSFGPMNIGYWTKRTNIGFKANESNFDFGYLLSKIIIIMERCFTIHILRFYIVQMQMISIVLFWKTLNMANKMVAFDNKMNFILHFIRYIKKDFVGWRYYWVDKL